MPTSRSMSDAGDLVTGPNTARPRSGADAVATAINDHTQRCLSKQHPDRVHKACVDRDPEVLFKNEQHSSICIPQRTRSTFSPKGSTWIGEKDKVSSLKRVNRIVQNFPGFALISLGPQRSAGQDSQCEVKTGTVMSKMRHPAAVSRQRQEELDSTSQLGDVQPPQGDILRSKEDVHPQGIQKKVQRNASHGSGNQSSIRRHTVRVLDASSVTTSSTAHHTRHHILSSSLTVRCRRGGAGVAPLPLLPPHHSNPCRHSYLCIIQTPVSIYTSTSFKPSPFFDS